MKQLLLSTLLIAMMAIFAGFRVEAQNKKFAGPSAVLKTPVLLIPLAPGGEETPKKDPETERQELVQKVARLEAELKMLRGETTLLRERMDALAGGGNAERLYEVPLGQSQLRGNADAPLTLVAFGDYQSNYTNRAHNVVRRLLEDFPQTLNFVFKHYPITTLHPQAQQAALAAVAAEKQEKAWEMHDLLLQNYRRLEPTIFLIMAQQLGMNITRFEEDRRSLWALERLTEDEKLAVKVEVAGVPTFFLNGRRMQNWRYDYLKAQVEKALKSLPPPPQPPDMNTVSGNG